MKRIAILVAAVAVVAAACGGATTTETAAGGETTTAPPATAAGGTTTAPPATAAPEGVCLPGQVDGDLDLYNWSEYIDPELIAAFEARYGVKVTETFFESNETMLAQIEAGGAAYDVIVPSDYMVNTMREVGLLVPLQKDALPNLGNLDPKFVNLPFDPNGDYSVPYQWGTTGIGYSFEAVGDETEISWGLIFDPEMSAPYAGKISLLNDERETLGAALKYLGYSVNSTDPAQIDEAAALIKAALPRIAAFDSDAFEDLLVTGETVIAHGWNGDFFAAFDENDAWEDFGYAIPVEGGVVWVDNMAIPTTADAVCTAHAFIDFLLEPENGAALTNFNFYASPNAAAEAFIDEEILTDEAIYPPPEVMEKLEFLEDVVDMATYYADAFIQAKSG